MTLPAACQHTVVSAVYPEYLSRKDYARAVAFYLALPEDGCGLTLYLAPELAADFSPLLGNPHVVLRVVPGAEFIRGLWLHEALTATGMSGPRLALSALSLRTIGLLHDETIHNPFGTRNFYWLHPRLAASLPLGYLTEASCLARRLPVTDRCLVLKFPEVLEDDFGNLIPMSSDIFGGSREAIAAINTMYWDVYAASLRDGDMPSGEACLGELIRIAPELFSCFVLQANGMTTSFFEALRRERVPLETAVLLG